jgi:hypothetical protein
MEEIYITEDIRSQIPKIKDLIRKFTKKTDPTKLKLFIKDIEKDPKFAKYKSLAKKALDGETIKADPDRLPFYLLFVIIAKMASKGAMASIKIGGVMYAPITVIAVAFYVYSEYLPPAIVRIVKGKGRTIQDIHKEINKAERLDPEASAIQYAQILGSFAVVTLSIAGQIALIPAAGIPALFSVILIGLALLSILRTAIRTVKGLKTEDLKMLEDEKVFTEYAVTQKLGLLYEQES